MSKTDVVEKVPLSISELKSEINSIEKRDGELGFRAGKVKEYVNSFSSLSKSAFVDLKKKIEELQVPRLKDEHIVKILDLLPSSVDELSVILQGYTLTVSKENMNAIVKVLKESGKA